METVPDVEETPLAERPITVTWGGRLVLLWLLPVVAGNALDLLSLYTLTSGLYGLMACIPMLFLVIEANRQQRWARNAIATLFGLKLASGMYGVVLFATTSLLQGHPGWPITLVLIFETAAFFVVFHFYTKPDAQVWYEKTPRRPLYTIAAVSIWVIAWVAPEFFRTWGPQIRPG